MRRRLGFLWLLGLCVFVSLIVAHGARDVVSAVGAVGWGFGIICLLHLLSLILHAGGWAVLLPRRSGRRFFLLLALRWIGDSVASLLPITAVGGDLLRGYLHQRTGVPGPLAIGAVVVDLTTEVAAQLAFAALALAVLLSRGAGPGTTVPIIVALGVLALLVYGFYLAQRHGALARSTRHLERIAGIGVPATFEFARTLDCAMRRIYRRRRRVRLSAELHLLAWLAGVFQVYVAAVFLGNAIDWLDALILEGLVTAARAAAFMIPGGLGVQEGAFILLGGLVGLPSEIALALSLVRRVRDLLFGAPGSLVWHAGGRRWASVPSVR